MPSTRRLRITGCLVILTFLIILYVTRGATSTQTSPFYTRTVEAIRNRQDAEARQAVLQEEKERMARVEQLEKEHEIAVSMKATTAAPATAQKTDAADVVHSPKSPEDKSVAGRKKIPGDRIVDTRPETDTDDGVPKIGNVQAKTTSGIKGDAIGPESEDDHKVELELTNILKKGPIIIFSKSYCPFSKKAKHILLDLYDITPPPFVVELDQHELGPGLQNALRTSTGRGTVPNILINATSIGGGDDIEHLHNEGTLIQTIQDMGGRRVVEVKAKTTVGDGANKAGLRFRA